MRLNAKQIAQCTGGEFFVDPIDPSAIIKYVEWDSREVGPESLFVALPGNKVDGHEFINDALSAGAMAVLVSDPVPEKTCGLAREMGSAIIQVPNTAHAVMDIAREWRSYLKGCVVAITGSVGKTTTKNLTRDVSKSAFSTIATKGNQNNELGCPKTILAAEADTEIVVVEMGMDGSGQIADLCKMARPHVGIVTNVGDSHLEALGTRENIARAKAELLQGLPDGFGVAILNAEGDFTDYMIEYADLDSRRIEKISFGGEALWAEKSVWADNVTLDGEGRPSFEIYAKGFDSEPAEPTLFKPEPGIEHATCRLTLRGAHNVLNACAASAFGLLQGIALEKIVDALSASVPEAGRQEILASRDGFTVINDAYNASPDSMRASLATLASMDVSGRRIAVLGDMGELGDGEVACHEGVGRAAAESNLDRLICIGELARHIADAAVDAGMDSVQVIHVASIGEALEALEGTLDSGDVVLVKASRFMELNRLAEGLAS